MIYILFLLLPSLTCTWLKPELINHFFFCTVPCKVLYKFARNKLLVTSVYLAHFFSMLTQNWFILSNKNNLTSFLLTAECVWKHFQSSKFLHYQFYSFESKKYCSLWIQSSQKARASLISKILSIIDSRPNDRFLVHILLNQSL